MTQDPLSGSFCDESGKLCIRLLLGWREASGINISQGNGMTKLVKPRPEDSIWLRGSVAEMPQDSALRWAVSPGGPALSTLHVCYRNPGTFTHRAHPLAPAGPASTAAWGQGGLSPWHGGPNLLSSPSTLSWESCRILRPFILKGRAGCFEVRYWDSSGKGTKGLWQLKYRHKHISGQIGSTRVRCNQCGLLERGC